MSPKSTTDLPKILVIVGQTATGKSSLAVQLAKEFNGEVVSADSRQIYQRLNIGTGKITKKEMQGVPHHLLDIGSARRTITVEEYKRKATKVIADILKRQKLPIICGGSGFYIQTLIDNTSFPAVEPNPTLRTKLEKLSAEELFKQLEKIDPARAAVIDPHNPLRLVRAIEIATTLGKVPTITNKPQYQPLCIGLYLSDEALKMKIYNRLLARLVSGNDMVKEAAKLHAGGISWRRLENLGLEYRWLSLYLRKKISREEMIKNLNTAIWHFAKRQKTWFKRNKKIKWFKPNAFSSIKKEVKRFLAN